MSIPIEKLVCGLLVFLMGRAGTAAAQYQIIHQTSSDTQLLTARVRAQTIGDLIDVSDCAWVSHDRYGRNQYDCKAAIEAVTGGRFMRSSYVITVGTDPNGGTYVDQLAFDAPLVDVTTVTREAALAATGAIGFHTTWAGDVYWQPGELVEVARLPLADGTVGVLHRYVVDFAISGHGGSGPIRSIGFKPFADFHVFDQGRIYRNWDWTLVGMSNYYLTVGYAPYVLDSTEIDLSYLLQ